MKVAMRILVYVGEDDWVEGTLHFSKIQPGVVNAFGRGRIQAFDVLNLASEDFQAFVDILSTPPENPKQTEIEFPERDRM